MENLNTSTEASQTTEPAIAVEPVLPPVFSFGEKGTDQWYAHKDGVHIPCDEAIIDKLWWQWIIAPTAERADNDKYTIFKVTEPGLVL